MKKIIILFVLFSFGTLLYAQNSKYYCEIKGIEKEISSGLKIVFDFGSQPTYSMTGLKGKQKLVDEKGKEIPFNSMVDAGNYLTQKGWTFLQAYSSSYGGNSIIHWIFYKEAASLEKAHEGIITKEDFDKKHGNED